MIEGEILKLIDFCYVTLTSVSEDIWDGVDSGGHRYYGHRHNVRFTDDMYVTNEWTCYNND